MATTYCTRADIDTLLSPAGVLACIDDDESGDESPIESLHVTKCIERAATKLNSLISRQYVLSEVTANAWMKWANAVLASMYLMKRRSNPLPQALADDVKEIEDLANEIAWGRGKLPEQAPSFDHSAATSSFNPQPGRYHPIGVEIQGSTGLSPVGNRKRHISSQFYPYY